MRVVFAYGILGGGGCEKRMGDLVRSLVRNGDEAWILGMRTDPHGEEQLFEQQGISRDRVFLADPEGAAFHFPVDYDAFIGRHCRELRADILDVQYTMSVPAHLPCRTIYTIHGEAQPIPAMAFDGILSVENLRVDVRQYPGQPYAEIHNWVDPQRFPYDKQLGEGACFIGRNFKTVNATKVAQFWKGTIDCYGIAELTTENYPPNMRWLGYTDSAKTMPQYRVVFGSAQVALEAISAGRLVIAGQHYRRAPAGVLVMPENLEALLDAQFYTQCQGDETEEPSAEKVYNLFQVAMANDFTRERHHMSHYVQRTHNMEGQIGKVRRFYEEVLAA